MNFMTNENNTTPETWLSIFRLHHANARTVIAQIRRGEWDFQYNRLTQGCCTAHRGEHYLWVGNGAFFCDVNDKNAFGLIFRHWVWWAAARKGRQMENRKHERPRTIDLT